MAGGSARVKFNVSAEGWKEAQELLEKIPILARGAALTGAIRNGMNSVKRRAVQLCPPAGYPGDKPGKIPLAETIIVAMRSWKGGWIVGGLVGPEYPAGAHGHLVEHGHRIATGGTLMPKSGSKRKTPPKSKATGKSGQGTHSGNVPPHPFMAPAWEEKKHEFEPKIMAALKKVITNYGG